MTTGFVAMRIVISALHFDWHDIDHCVDRVENEFGLDGVELSFHESFSRPHCTREDLSVLQGLKGGSDLVLSAHIWEDLARMVPKDAERALLGWLAVCEKTGTSGLVFHGGTYPDRREGIAGTRRVLQQVLPEFERSGVVLHIENHYAYEYEGCNELFSEPWEFREVFSLESPFLRFCFDTGHGHMTRNWRLLLDDLGPHLAYVHLADNFGANDDHCAYREGTVPWDSIFDRLERIRFDGAFCVEFPVREDTGPFHACVQDLRNRWGGC